MRHLFPRLVGEACVSNDGGKLPDDVEQYLINGQRTRATWALMERRGITINQARQLIGRWLFEPSQVAAPPE
jgi:hypothetical protein